MALHLRRSIVVVLTSLALATAAVAQSVPAGSNQHLPAGSPNETVTVTGQREIDQQFIQTVIAPFVAQHAAPDRKSGLLVRDAPSGICVMTMGLPPAFNDFVAARIYNVARTVGDLVRGPGQCQPNVEIIFTEDPQQVVNKLADITHGQILGFYFVHEKNSLVHVWRPIQAWYVTGTSYDPNGEAKMVTPDDRRIGTEVGVVPDDAYGQSPYTGTGSRIRPRNSSEIINALILVDTSKLAGHEIGPIADYVSMLALSQPESMDACNPLPSILDLFAKDCYARQPPDALTSADIAYLKALYAADITTSGYTAQEKVQNGMANGLNTPQQGQR